MPSLKMLLDSGEFVGTAHGYLCKTHYPFLFHRRENIDIQIGRGIILFRDPIQSTYSMFNLFLYDHHTKKQDMTKHRNSPEFLEIMKFLVDRWVHNHNFWLKLEEIPKIWVTYEEFLNNPESLLVEIFTFCLGFDVRNTEIHEKIKRQLSEKGMASAYLSRPAQKVELVQEMPRELVEYIYKECFVYLVQGNFVHKYEQALGLSLTNIPKEKEKAKMDFLESRKAAVEKSAKGEMQVPVKPFLIHTTKEDHDAKLEEMRSRIKEFLKLE